MTRTVLSAVTLCSLFTLCTKPANAQGLSFTHSFNHSSTLADITALDVKQYATEMVMHGGPDEHVMAGTIYDKDGVYSSIHFLRVDNTGTILTSVEFESDPPVLILPDNDYVFRSVDIASGDYMGNNAHFITCLGQQNLSPYSVGHLWGPTAPYTYAGQPNKEIIRIIATDDNGVQYSTLDITDNTNIPNFIYQGYNLEPLNSLYTVVNGQKLLFICGIAYLDEAYATTGGAPTSNYQSPKESFILCVDVSNPNNMTIIGGKAFNTPLNAPAITGGDYDMFTRMKEIKSGPDATSSTTNPCIFVTGSGNCQTSPSNPSWNRSASLIYVLHADPVPGNFLTLVNDTRILPIQIGSDGDGEMEYGFDMTEDSANNRFYLLSNKMPHKPTYTWYTNSYPTGYNYHAMDPEPTGMLITQLDQSYAPTPNAIGRLFLPEIWGVHSLRSIKHNIAGFDLMIAGLANQNYAGYAWGSISDVTPYLLDINVNFSMSPALAALNVNSFTSYPTGTGTGTPGTDANNYFTLGSYANGTCNIYWNPVFAARGTGDTDMVYMSAPKWNGLLNLKWIQADATPGSPTWPIYDDGNCFAIPLNLVNIPSGEGYTAQSTWTIKNMDLLPATPTPTQQVIYDNPKTCADAKATGIKPLKANTNTLLFPNPATGSVSLVLAANIAKEASIKVQLLNIQGQVVSTLYTGTAANAAKKYTLPALPVGNYMAQVYADGVLVHQQKLAIQQ